MNCPECRSRDTGVSNTVHKRHGTNEQTVRYHRCNKCSHRFKSTQEVVVKMEIRQSRITIVKD